MSMKVTYSGVHAVPTRASLPRKDVDVSGVGGASAFTQCRQLSYASDEHGSDGLNQETTYLEAAQSTS